MNKTVSVAEAKNQLSELLNRVHYRGERILVTKRGKPIGALVSARDLEMIEKADKEKTLRRVREIQKRTKKYIPYEQFVRDYEKKWGVKLDEIEPEE